MRVWSVLLLVVCACRFEAGTGSAPIACSASSDCPVGFRCAVRVNTCVPSTTSDTEAPRVSATLSTKLAKPGARLTLTVTPSESVRLLQLAVVPAEGVTLESTSLTDVTAPVSVGVSIPSKAEDGVVRFLATAVDAFGNEVVGLEVAALTVDATPPAPTGVVTTLTPRAGCPLSAVTALGPGGTFEVRLGFNEPLSAAPTAQLLLPNAAPIPLRQQPTADGSTWFSVTLPSDSVLNGVATLELRAIDEALNEAVVEVSGLRLTLDASPPTAPPVEVPQAIEYLRAPWGTDTSGPRFSVTLDAGVLQPNQVLRVLAEPQGAELARASFTDGGAVSLTLPTLDRGAVWLTQVDTACNESVPIDVKDVRWVATAGSKRAGSFVENPHLFEAFTDFTGALQGGSEFDAGVIARVDGVRLSSRMQPRWSQPLEQPDTRRATALAYDSVRQRTVLISGEGERVGDVWEWDGASWTNRTPNGGPRPSRRIAHSAVYDSARRRVVLFGGADSQGSLNDVWEWDGSSWLDRTPTSGTQPSPRQGQAMAFDSARNVTVLFGGRVADDSVWEWNGEAWREVPRTDAGVWPTARTAHVLAFDAARGVTVLFGGDDQTTALPARALNDVFEWNGATWVAVTPTTASIPEPRHFAAAAYDSVQGAVVVVGGLAADAGFTGAETWEWKNATWTRATQSPQPTPRASAALAFDAARQTLVLFGGWTPAQGLNNDTWLRHGTTWAQAARPSNVVPAPRAFHAATYDPLRERVVVFGGELDAGLTNAVLEWNGASWGARPTPTQTPLPRDGAALVFDPVRGRSVLVQGHSLDGNARTVETWEWNGASWDLPDAGPAPDQRNLIAAAYDVPRQRLVMFGGAGFFNADGNTSELWERVDTTWQRRTLSLEPPARRGSAAVFDLLRAVTLVYGGLTNTVINDTWLWNGTSWAVVATGLGSPPARWNHALAYDETRARAVLFGGRAGVAKRDTWEWDGASWVAVEPVGPIPPARFGHVMAWDRARERVVLHGGKLDDRVNPKALFDDTWEYGLGARSRPGVTARFSFGAAGAPVEWVQRVSLSAVAGGSGFDGATSVAGVELSAWERAAYLPRTTNAAAVSAPASVEWSTSDRSTLARLFAGPTLELGLAVAPRGFADGAPAVKAAQLGVDAVQLEVRYRRP